MLGFRSDNLWFSASLNPTLSTPRVQIDVVRKKNELTKFQK